ncbi:MAG: hypothetical protein B6I36_01525 [Desulfobacteraceae bacterium 4572_35.1]|nr:MAG: hypothetical protein B6I36_01525 [Desulfobacteraceae bacterium 4572_35.1]
MTRMLLLLMLCVASSIAVVPCYGDEPIKVSDVHLQLAQRHLDAGHPFWSIHSYRRALASGADNPNTHLKLSRVLYDVGFVDQAISEMDLALKNASDTDFLHMEMGMYCLASGQLQRALTEFKRVLQLNSGFSYGYYYMGEVYYRLADYDHAAMSLQFAQYLGLPGFDLERKLKDLGWKVPQSPWQDNNQSYCLRQIVLDNKSDAEDVQQRLADGELFEELARKFSKGVEADSGGYIGEMNLTSMPDVFARKLADVSSFSAPLLLESAGEYIIVQRISLFEPSLWQKRVNPTVKNGQYRAQETVNAVRGKLVPKKYALLSGVYHQRKYADQRVQQLLDIGFKSYLRQRGSGSHLRYEVIVGRFAEYKTAEKAGVKIKRSGLDYYIRKEGK